MKKLALLIISIMLSIMLVGCDDSPSVTENAYSTTETTNVNPAINFKTLATYVGYKIVYNEKTRVMYSVSTGGYNTGNMTVLLNADGTPMLWE